MAVVEIKIADVDLTDQVVFREAEFISATNGTVGECRLLIRDETATYTVATGSKLELLIDGDPVWTGFVTTFERTYVFPAINVADFGPARFFRITGVDLNTLFNKRIAYTKADPEDVFGKLYPPGTADIDVIADLVADYLDLSGDDLDTSTKVENVGDINVDQDARAWLASDSFGQAMASIASLPGAVYFIDPTRYLVYTDANTADAPFGLSDQPSSGGATIYFEDDYSGSSASDWPGWTTDAGSPFIVGPGSVEMSEGSGVGRIDLTMVPPGPSDIISQSVSSPFTESADGLLAWRLTVVLQTNYLTGTLVQFGPGINNYSWGMDLAVNNDDAGSINFSCYSPSDGANVNMPDPWDDSQPYVAELLKASDGTVEGRLWLQSGSRPASPDVTFTDATALDATDLANFYGQTFGAGDGLVSVQVSSYVLDAEGSGATVGYREMTITRDGSSLANDVLAWGIGYGSQAPVFVRDEDAPSQAEHGVWQLGTQRNGIYKQATINRVAASIVDGSPENLRGAKDDKVSVDLVTYEPGFLPAQKVDFTSAVWDFNDVIPIRRMRVTFDAPDTPRYELNLSHAIDAPWNFFDQYLLKLPPLPPLPHLPPLPSLSCLVFDDFERTAGPLSWGTASIGVEWGTVEERPFSAGTNVVNVTTGFGRIYPTCATDGATAATVPVPLNVDYQEFAISGTAHLVPNFPTESDSALQSAILDWRINVGDGAWDWSNQIADGTFISLLNVVLTKAHGPGDPDPAGGELDVLVWNEDTGTFVSIFTASGILSLASFEWSLDRSVSRGTMVIRLNSGPGGIFDNFSYEFAIDATNVPAGPLNLWAQGYANAQNLPSDYTPETTLDNLVVCGLGSLTPIDVFDRADSVNNYTGDDHYNVASWLTPTRGTPDWFGQFFSFGGNPTSAPLVGFAVDDAAGHIDLTTQDEPGSNVITIQAIVNLALAGIDPNHCHIEFNMECIDATPASLSGGTAQTHFFAGLAQQGDPDDPSSFSLVAMAEVDRLRGLVSDAKSRSVIVEGASSVVDASPAAGLPETHIVIDRDTDRGTTQVTFGSYAMVEEPIGSDTPNMFIAYIEAQTKLAPGWLSNLVVSNIIGYGPPSAVSIGSLGAACQSLRRLSSTGYAMSSPFVPNSTIVWRAGLLQRRGVDYTETASTGTVIFDDPVAVGEFVFACAQMAALG